MFFSYSMMGWAIECTYCSVPEGRFINRGFLNGPYIPIYGFGAMIAALLLSPLGSPALIFVAGGTLSCLMEYVTSYVMERVYHARWWDYSDHPLNLNGRIWAGGFVQFGICCVLVVYVSQPPLLEALRGLSPTACYLLAGLSLACFMTDLTVTHLGITDLRDKMDFLRAELLGRLDGLRDALPSRPELAGITNWDHVVQSSLARHLGSAAQRVLETAQVLPSLDEVTRTFSAMLSSQERRIMQAFPKLRPSDYRAKLEEFYRSRQQR